MTLGNPCVWRMFKNSKVSISKPNLASTHSKTRSAILAQSSIAAVSSLGHSKRVIRLCFEVTTVIGPVTVVKLWFVYNFTRDRISVDFPTPFGPMTTTRAGGDSFGSIDRRSVSGTYSFFWERSRLRCIVRCVRPMFATENARELCRSFLDPSFFALRSFFFSLAPRPSFFCLCRWFSMISAPSMVDIVVSQTKTANAKQLLGLGYFP
mmetsp:Transcript_7407/g.18136  ORF Transcript_7407/g.18136 Transcript_7407/m.18136 type:complete len:208 (+) Transcript_7407:42-665(+)